MEKTALFLNFKKVLVLVFSFAIAFTSCQNGGEQATGTGAATGSGSVDGSTSSANGGKAFIEGIAFVQMDSVINNYDMYHDKRAEFEKEAKKMESELSAQVRKFQKEATDFQEKYEKGLMTRSQAEEVQQKLQRSQQDLESRGNKMRQDLAEKEAVIGREIQVALNKFIEKYNADKRYSLILNNATVLYGAPAMDITNDVLKGLNEGYIASKESK